MLRLVEQPDQHTLASLSHILPCISCSAVKPMTFSLWGLSSLVFPFLPTHLVPVLCLSALQHIKAFYNSTWSQRYGHGLAPGPLTLLYSLTVSTFSLGGLVGSLLVGVLVERYGR